MYLESLRFDEAAWNELAASYELNGEASNSAIDAHSKLTVELE